jgi:hypothetical protein
MLIFREMAIDDVLRMHRDDIVDLIAQIINRSTPLSCDPPDVLVCHHKGTMVRELARNGAV